MSADNSSGPATSTIFCPRVRSFLGQSLYISFHIGVSFLFWSLLNSHEYELARWVGFLYCCIGFLFCYLLTKRPWFLAFLIFAILLIPILPHRFTFDTWQVIDMAFMFVFLPVFAWSTRHSYSLWPRYVAIIVKPDSLLEDSDLASQITSFFKTEFFAGVTTCSPKSVAFEFRVRSNFDRRSDDEEALHGRTDHWVFA